MIGDRMIMDINEHRQIRLKEVYEPVELQSPSGESIFVCMRDGKFELSIEVTGAKSVDGVRHYTPYNIRDGQIEPLTMQEM